MCGIAGFQGRYPSALLTRMSAYIAHRGPDGDGAVMLGEAGSAGLTGLAHRRLAIIDLSEDGRQPMTVGCGACGAAGFDDLALVYNGELYNYRELRQGLEAHGHVFRSHSDTEVLLHLYAEAGPGMLARLNGIFAFVIRDGRVQGRAAEVERGDLFVVRDHLGVKPLYHASTASGYLFASELKALLASTEVSREIDHVAVHEHLAHLWTPAPRTFLAGIRKLPPGSAHIVHHGRVQREWCYYSLPYCGERARGSRRALAEEVAVAVEEAVRRQMVADVPVGAFLSGGLDSSAVVAMMRRVAPGERPTCFSIGFSDAQIDGAAADLPYARRVATHLGVDLRTIEVGPDIIGQLARMLFLLDEPQADPAPINALLIAEAARREGLKVLLSGAGGDDIFSGYRRHQAVRLERWWTWLPPGARAALAAGARRAASGQYGLRMGTAVRRGLKAFAHADLEGDARLASYFWWSGDALRRGLYSRAMAEAVGGADAAAPLLASLEQIPAEHDPLNRMLFLESRHFLPDHNLNYTDKMGMAAGVEVRVPLLDLDLVALGARIPPGEKQRGRLGKAIFKQAMEPYLPPDVIYRPKSGFGAPLRRWLRQELRMEVEATLAEPVVARRGLFDPAAVRRLVEQDRAGRVDGAYTIFALMCIELWCRMFVDAPMPQVPSSDGSR